MIIWIAGIYPPDRRDGTVALKLYVWVAVIDKPLKSAMSFTYLSVNRKLYSRCLCAPTLFPANDACTIANVTVFKLVIHNFIGCHLQTDPANVDYSLESGATRNFEAAKTLMEIEKKKLAAAEAEEAANPMKVSLPMLYALWNCKQT